MTLQQLRHDHKLSKDSLKPFALLWASYNDLVKELGEPASPSSLIGTSFASGTRAVWLFPVKISKNYSATLALYFNSRLRSGLYTPDKEMSFYLSGTLSQLGNIKASKELKLLRNRWTVENIFQETVVS